jgi:DNA primase
MDACADALWSDTRAAASARRYLRQRGFTEATARDLCFGLHAAPERDAADLWGIDGRPVWLPRGIVIPWQHEYQLWGLNIRRPNGDLKADASKYHRVRGTTNALYNADAMDGRPVVLVEGELDAAAVQQSTDEAAAVATGSTSWGRLPRWRALLRAAPLVLVAFDAEAAGEDAARYWTDTLPNAVRWRPHWHDVAEMLEEGADVARWVSEGLDTAARHA